jgi:hypothetical protein
MAVTKIEIKRYCFDYIYDYLIDCCYKVLMAVTKNERRHYYFGYMNDHLILIELLLYN